VSGEISGHHSYLLNCITPAHSFSAHSAPISAPLDDAADTSRRPILRFIQISKSVFSRVPWVWGSPWVWGGYSVPTAALDSAVAWPWVWGYKFRPTTALVFSTDDSKDVKCR